ncbi:MAG: type II toxin-antitoxin system death-on-curing family toxin [Wenzhouxiangellaceae bacterium]
MNEPVWLSVELIERVHDRQLAEHGGPSGVRDRGMLESALGRPLQKFAYGGLNIDLPVLAAAYAFGLARNHPFVDGNKRTVAVACELFLELNGYLLVAADEDLYPVFAALAAGDLPEDQLAEWLRHHSRPEQVSEPVGSYR